MRKSNLKNIKRLFRLKATGRFEPSAIRQAESKIAGCERCQEDEADHPFDFILAKVLGKHGAFEFILTGTVRCPNCKAELTEKTLVEPQGGD